SDTNTGTCLRPSCTAIVCPTISGKIVEARDQVRIIRLSPAAFIDSMRLKSRSLTNGPFLDDLGIYLLSLPRRRPRTINLSDSLCFGRVRFPIVGTPHGVTGWWPFDLPSPPPCGWSTGFIAVPRTEGRLPSHRLRPALPLDSFEWSVFPTWPTVARHVSSTRRISPEGRRRTP